MKRTSGSATFGSSSFVSGSKGTGTYWEGSPPSHEVPGAISRLVVEEDTALLAEAGLKERLADLLDEVVEAPVLAVHVQLRERVAGRCDSHRLEDDEGHPLAQARGVLRHVVEDEPLVAVVLLRGHVAVEVDLEPGLAGVARAGAPRADTDLRDHDAVHAEVRRVVLVEGSPAQASPSEGSRSSRASSSAFWWKSARCPRSAPGWARRRRRSATSRSRRLAPHAASATAAAIASARTGAHALTGALSCTRPRRGTSPPSRRSRGPAARRCSARRPRSPSAKEHGRPPARPPVARGSRPDGVACPVPEALEPLVLLVVDARLLVACADSIAPGPWNSRSWAGSCASSSLR